MFKPITSPDNNTVKHIRKLSDARYRAKTGEFLIEGKKEVTEALDSRFDISVLVVSESYLKNIGADDYACVNERIVVPDKLFCSMADTVTPQGILCVSKMPPFSGGLPDSGIFIFCDAVSDPGNLGTIIRTADAAGLDGVIVSKGCCDVFSPKTIRSTMGSVFHIPILPDDNAIDTLKSKGYKIAAGTLQNAVSLYDADLSGNIVLVVGNESGGVSQTLLEKTDLPLKIPMPGKAESLNVSAAAAVMIYETIRQNNKWQ